ncbi:MAG: hypothetical protein RIC56_03010 [Pseudomonadales bacterium]
MRDSLAVISTIEAVRTVIRHSNEFKQLKTDIESEAISEGDIREFVSRQLSYLRPGESFPFEGALSAIAIALENCPTEFASSYLEDLSQLDIAEIQIAPKVARRSLELQRTLADVTYRRFGELIHEEGLTLYPQVGRVGSGSIEDPVDLRVA